MRVVVCTMYSPSHQELADLTVPNMKEYAQKHGYDTYEIKIENDKWEYKKHEAFSEYFKEGYDLIWYKDVDSVITNLTVPITDFVDGKHDFFITKDFTELNGGSVIIKNTNHGKWMNDEILRMRNEFENEQNVINSLYTQPVFRKGVRILSHPSINSYRYDLYPECKEYIDREDLGDWVEGKSFVLHVPALALEKRIEILKNTPIIE